VIETSPKDQQLANSRTWLFRGQKTDEYSVERRDCLHAASMCIIEKNEMHHPTVAASITSKLSIRSRKRNYLPIEKVNNNETIYCKKVDRLTSLL
jgi:hypothetical protein